MERFAGVPVWHASVAKHEEAGLVPVSRWREKDWTRARRLLADVLEGAGGIQQVEETQRASLQMRRLATDAERAVIGPTKDVR